MLAAKQPDQEGRTLTPSELRDIVILLYVVACPVALVRSPAHVDLHVIRGHAESAEVISFMALAFYLFDIILAVANLALLPFVEAFRARYPDKTVWCYSGYTWEQLTGAEPCRCRCEVTDRLLALYDVLVDGEFIEEQKSLNLRFKGSANQRTILVKESLAAGDVMLYDLEGEH